MQERKAVEEAAGIIGISIRTAPKSGGIDDIAYLILTDTQKVKVVKEFKNIAEALKKNKPLNAQKAIALDWHSDAEAVEKSDCLIIIGVKGRKPLGLDCGGCGFRSCGEFLEGHTLKASLVGGPFCMFKLWDLGVAVSSACITASSLHIDNRIMYKAGLSAYRLGLLKPCNPILGLPLSARGKNIFFDRLEKLKARELLQSQKRRNDKK